MAHVAIQVVTYFGSGDLPALLASLARQTHTDWHLYVHENSCDASESARIGALLAASGVRYTLTVADENEGFSAHNRLWRAQDAPFVLVVNQDAALDPRYLEEALAAVQQGDRIAAVAGRVLRWDGGAFPDAAQGIIDTAGLEYQQFSQIRDRFAGQVIPSLAPTPVFGVSGAVALYRRHAVETVAVEPGELFVPGFFMYREDVELAIRLQRAGFVTQFVPSAIAYHRRALREEGATGWARIRAERRRSSRVRMASYRNAWWLVVLHASSALPWSDRLRSVFQEWLRGMMVCAASPTVFARAWFSGMRGTVRMWKRRRAMNRRFPPFAGYRAPEPLPAWPAEKRWPKVGIIYLTYPTANGQRDIDRCLASLQSLDYPKDRVELICVESKGKLPPIKPWFEQTWMPKSGTTLPRIHYIFRDEWIGFSGNNNLGLEKAQELGCDYVHLTNEDTDVDPAYLRTAVMRAESDPTIGIVQSLLLLGEKRAQVNSLGNAYHVLGHGYSAGYLWTVDQAEGWIAQTRVTNPSLQIPYASGAAMLVRIASLEGKALFDEKFFSYHEDTDIALRLRMRGWKTVLEPTSRIWHYYEFAKSKINYYYMERNRYVLPLTYYRLPTLILLAPLFVALDVATLVFSVRGGWADMKGKVYRDFASKEFWSWIWSRRKQAQRLRTISDRAFLRLATAEIAFQQDGVKNPVLSYLGNPLMRIWWRSLRAVMWW